MGFIIPGGRGYVNSGYRYYSMNLLSPIDPGGYPSGILRSLHQATGGQYEGYNYLGAGVLLLAVINLGLVLYSRGKLRPPDVRSLYPLLLCCLFLTLMALSTKVTLGSSTLIDLDGRERVSSLLAPLRATGRLFWLPYYAILTALLVAPFLLLGKSGTNLLIAGILVLQLADMSPLRRSIHTEVNRPHPTPLKSAIWSRLGSVHENLIVLPAWQCGGTASPGGEFGYRFFGFLAVSQKMRTNSYSSARYTEAARDRECTESITALTERKLSPDSAYVVTPSVAALIGRGPTGPGKCHYLDRFILCSSKSDFGLTSSVVGPEIPLQNALGNPSYRGA